MAELTDRRCKPGAKRLTAEQARERLGQLTGWTIEKDGTELHRTFRFPNYHETMAFVNAVPGESRNITYSSTRRRPLRGRARTERRP